MMSLSFWVVLEGTWVHMWDKVLTYFCDLHKNLGNQGSRFIDVRTDSEAFWILLLPFGYSECGLLCNPFQG